MNPSTKDRTPTQTPRRVELLAPARDLHCGITAINCGADAIYIGAPKFSARREAGNPVSDIAALATHAHLYGAKVYVPLNTVLFDDELEDAEALVHEVYDAGADGLIIQDMGILEMDLPPIPLIASTQAHNANAERIRFLENVGFKRAILARELSLAEIRHIRESTNHIELECFVHGALCVSYSGRCYLSLARGGRSGNRGECAQPCRMHYRLIDGMGDEHRSGHLLSIRDLDRSGSLAELLDAGVTSFKLEGRLKDRAFIANTVSYYRRALDAVLEERPDRFTSPRHLYEIPFEPDPARTFRRGATDFGLYGPSIMGSPDLPASHGELLGKVTKIVGKTIRIDTDTPLAAGDGLRWLSADGRATGSRVQKIEGATVHLQDTAGLRPGLTVYRNLDHKFRMVIEHSNIRRRIPITISAEMFGDRLRIVAATDEGPQATATSEEDIELAQQPEKARQVLTRQLRRTGDTPFFCEDVTLRMDEPPFAPVSVLNALRRRALADLEERILAAYQKPERPLTRNDFPHPETELDFEANVTNRLAVAFYRRHGAVRIEPGAEKAGLPENARVMTSIYCLRRELDACLLEEGGKKLEGPLTLLDDRGGQLRLAFDCAACRMSVFICPANG